VHEKGFGDIERQSVAICQLDNQSIKPVS